MTSRFLLPSVLLAVAAGVVRADEPPGYGPGAATFQVTHSLHVKDIPAGSKKARVWFWFPSDDDYQRVHDIAVAAPGKFQVTRDKEHGHYYLYTEVAEPAADLRLSTDFLISRREASFKLDPAKAGPITDNHRSIFAEHLRKDCPCMEVTEELVKLANDICGEEINVVEQTSKIFKWVVANTDHYSMPGAPKSSGIGSAVYCLKNKGGGCTDQHALFMTLARARGIPTRISFGSILRPTNEGKDHNPGYRCWVQYFVPNYGWVSADASEGDIKNKVEYYTTNLDERHIRFCEGRDLQLNPPQTGARVNLFLFAHIEVDGRPHTTFERSVRFKSK